MQTENYQALDFRFIVFIYLLQVNRKAGESLADPEEYPNLFDDWQVSLSLESKAAENRYIAHTLSCTFNLLSLRFYIFFRSFLALLLFPYLLHYVASNNFAFYFVLNGRQPGIYFYWPRVLAQIENFPNPVFKGFYTFQDAF